MLGLVLSNKMDICYLLVDVQEIRIQPYFWVKQGDYFFTFSGTPCIVFVGNLNLKGHMKVK